jgi:hypothetical protein
VSDLQYKLLVGLSTGRITFCGVPLLAGGWGGVGSRPRLVIIKLKRCRDPTVTGNRFPVQSLTVAAIYSRRLQTWPVMHLIQEKYFMSQFPWPGFVITVDSGYIGLRYIGLHTNYSAYRKKQQDWTAPCRDKLYESKDKYIGFLYISEFFLCRPYKIFHSDISRVYCIRIFIMRFRRLKRRQDPTVTGEPLSC